jgi:hypothetical protein
MYIYIYISAGTRVELAFVRGETQLVTVTLTRAAIPAAPPATPAASCDGLAPARTPSQEAFLLEIEVLGLPALLVQKYKY